ncbi:cell cycle control protein cwf19 [Rhizodiscina lignyota]|uniref:Cell cycle control protein cwf19 n=1 Tax=Rhizodiscina lignyota TaxID=1504668 RepID=A0A9P4I3Z2_9PEZI|nr:cell cycle control protein cwf19 [Rhizodiscina lignyota]
MTLEDFERELAASKAADERKNRERSRDREARHTKKDRHHKHDHHHSSRRHSSHDRDYDRESNHRHKRRRHDDDEDRERRREDRHSKRDPGEENEELDERLAESEELDLKRDDWMQVPSALDVDYVQRNKPPPKAAHTKSARDEYELKIHEKELNHQLRDVKDANDPSIAVTDELAQHEVSYEFGDSGSQWRMTKLKAVYRQAEETGTSVEEIALERYGGLREFDDAREEEIELDRRKTYGKEYVGKIKPSGELFQERKMAMGIRRQSSKHESSEQSHPVEQGRVFEEQPPLTKTIALDQTALNKLKAQMMKAKLRKASNAADLEAEYNNALAAAANHKEPEVVVLSAMDSRMLAGGRKGEVNALQTKRGKERGLVEENEDMSVEDMVRQERRTRGQAGGSGLEMAERIAKDAKFDNDLDYMDENAEKLSKRVVQSDINLRNTAIGDFQKMNRILENCPLCHHEDKGTLPIAPIVSLATRVYLTLPTDPEISEGGACIVPIQHRINLLECDDDEWEEIRNFMKCLIRMYHDQGRDVIFYENAATPHRKRHAAMEVVPLPYSLGETAPAFFREAILSADEEWTQHKKLIDTLKRSKEGLGRSAFRKTIAKEMPYFHVWFELDGGMGHIVEDERRWPKGDLFARETLGGMLDAEPDVIKRQGKWNRNDRRVDGFKKRWRKFDWTRVLTDG